MGGLKEETTEWFGDIVPPFFLGARRKLARDYSSRGWLRRRGKGRALVTILILVYPVTSPP